MRYPTGKIEESYEIPQGIESIGDNAFSWSENLQTVTIPESVTSIYYEAFSNCPELKSVNIPDSVSVIDETAFRDSNKVVITVERNSYAQKFCQINNLEYNYPDSLDWLSE